ncbi:MAG: hypothetical protein Q4P13_03680 [Psychrobacter sp.]|nr:hypothetical protein [Psychrobacter sp.]
MRLPASTFVFTLLPIKLRKLYTSLFGVGLMALTGLANANVTSGLGTFTLDGGATVTATSATGRYQTDRGATGKFTITLDATNGYDGAPTFEGGANGLQVLNPVSRDVHDDRFTYTLTLFADDSRIVNSIKLAQTSYRTSGNSEVAKQTLNYVNNDASGKFGRASVTTNPNVSFYYLAMGDYFMAEQVGTGSGATNTRRFRFKQPVSAPQLRRDDSSSPVYYYSFDGLKTTYYSNFDYYRIDTNASGYAELKPKQAGSNAIYGSLPPQPTPERIVKSLGDPASYPALPEGAVIPNGGSYVSFGVENINTKYVVDVYNAKSVTLSYEGIMRGNSGNSNPSNTINPEYGNPTTVGETENEWITFGIVSEPPPNIIPAPPNSTEIVCSPGYIADDFANDDYTNLAPNTNPPTPKSNYQVVGKKSESYIIVSNTLKTTGTLDTNSSNFYRPTTSGGVFLFEFFQDFADKASTRTITYNFNNKFTGAPEPLEKFSLSIMDLDSYYTGGRYSPAGRYYPETYEYMDSASITGYTAAGTAVTPRVTYKGANISANAPYSPTVRGRTFACDNNVLDGNCQVAVTFDQPVVRVDVTYGNDPSLIYWDVADDDRDGIQFEDPGDQYIAVKIDGYCYKPQPRLIYTKKLADPRAADTDQFKVQIKDNFDNSVVTSALTQATTTGTSNVVTTGTGTTGLFKIDPTKTYTLTEVGAGTTDLTQYSPSYDCTKFDGTKVTTLDPNSLKLTYGDNWSCTVTNSKPKLTISGTVFNDKGSVTSPSKDDVSSKYTDDLFYFNGKFDTPTESGIPFTPGHTITLAKCADDNSTGTFIPKTTAINANGFYTFELTPNEKGTSNKLCVTQNEPAGYIYSVDTTKNVREIIFKPTIYDYPSNDFGDVLPINAALVLIKSQYVHDCSLTDLSKVLVNYSGLPTVAFSKQAATNVAAGQCIAYRIEALNRGHVDLTEVVISDDLQTNGIGGAKVTSTLIAPSPMSEKANGPTFEGLNMPLDSNRRITTNGFKLAAPTTSVATMEAIRFNTKYGIITKAAP